VWVALLETIRVVNEAGSVSGGGSLSWKRTTLALKAGTHGRFRLVDRILVGMLVPGTGNLRLNQDGVDIGPRQKEASNVQVRVLETEMNQHKERVGVLFDRGSQMIPVHVFGGNCTCQGGLVRGFGSVREKGAFHHNAVVLLQEFGVLYKDGLCSISQEAKYGLSHYGAGDSHALLAQSTNVDAR
jgi:hypothetical protein